jgi:hypothetical protein
LTLIFTQILLINTVKLIQEPFFGVLKGLVILIVGFFHLVVLVVELILCVLVSLAELDLASVHTGLLRD